MLSACSVADMVIEMMINKDVSFKRTTVLWKKYSNILSILDRKFYDIEKA